MSARRYLQEVQPLVERLGHAELPNIQRAGALVAASIGGGHRVWVSKTTHCLHSEAHYRAGGLVPAHVLEDPLVIEHGDTVLMGTNAGTTFVAVEIASIARERGAHVVVLSQLAYERSPLIESKHPSGKRLHEIGDVVVDLAGSVGDGVMELLDTGVRIMPSSGVTGMVAMWMIFSEAVGLLCGQGKIPMVTQSLQLPGAIPRNEELIARYRRTRVGYTPARVAPGAR
ncbi:MAG TPA: hypothetical protein VG370_02070 [Chloroflexota bacterium]|jgi:uncharacterized phosphosugar-binding protein|nr:hypothetical protein [Chloroflexota bacterium]